LHKSKEVTTSRIWLASLESWTAWRRKLGREARGLSDDEGFILPMPLPQAFDSHGDDLPRGGGMENGPPLYVLRMGRRVRGKQYS